MTLLYWFQKKFMGMKCGKDMDHDWDGGKDDYSSGNKLFTCGRCDKQDRYTGKHPPLRD